MTTEDDFQKALDANPDDWQTRLVLADFLDDRADPRAAGYRVMGRLKIVPFYSDGARHLRDTMQFWCYRCKDTGSSYGNELRPRWFNRLTKEEYEGSFRPPPDEHAYRYRDSYRGCYKTRRFAEDDCARAFAQMLLDFPAMDLRHL